MLLKLSRLKVNKKSPLFNRKRNTDRGVLSPPVCLEGTPVLSGGGGTQSCRGVPHRCYPGVPPPPQKEPAPWHWGTPCRQTYTCENITTHVGGNKCLYQRQRQHWLWIVNQIFHEKEIWCISVRSSDRSKITQNKINFVKNWGLVRFKLITSWSSL